MISSFVFGLLFCVNVDFVGVYMTETMNHATNTVIALVGIVATLSELLIYPLTSWLIKHLGGPIPCVCIGIFSYVPRFLLTSLCTDARYLVPVQLFHGIGFALTWTAIVEHTYAICPKEVTNTAIGLLWNLSLVASDIVAGAVGGQVHKQYGGAAMFQGAACVAGVWCLVMAVYLGRFAWSKRNFVSNSLFGV